MNTMVTNIEKLIDQLKQLLEELKAKNMDTITSTGSPPHIPTSEVPMASSLVSSATRTGGTNYGRSYVEVAGLIAQQDGTLSTNWYRINWGEAGGALENSVTGQGSTIKTSFGLSEDGTQGLVEGVSYEYEIEVLSGNPTTSPSVLSRSGRKQVLIPISTANIALSTQTVVVYASDPTAIRAKVDFTPLSSSGSSPILAYATTKWRFKGDTGWPYEHVSPREFSYHSQYLPDGTPGEGNNGPYLIPGSTVEYQTTITDLNGEVYIGPIEEFEVADVAFLLSDPVFTINTTNLNAIVATLRFNTRKTNGDLVPTRAVTWWREKGQSTWTNKHDSVDQYPEHVQPIPRGTPNTGTNGPYLIAGREYEFYIEVTDGVDTVTSDTETFKVPGSGSSTGSGGSSSGTFTWGNLQSPPTLSNVRKFYGKSSLGSPSYASGNKFNCAGPYYRISGSASEDALIIMIGETLTMPLWVDGFRNVILVGGSWQIGVTSGCAAGELKMWASGRGADYDSLHPHMPTNRLLHFDCTHTAWIEGVNCHAGGNATDIIVSNGSLDVSRAHSMANRKTYLINSRARAWEGVTGPDGKGFHGDLIQNQQLRLGRDKEDYSRSCHSVILENVTSLTGMSHLSLGQDDPWSKISLRNVYFDMDPQIAADQNGIRGPENSSDTSPDEQKGPVLYCRVYNDEDLEVDNVVYRTQRHSSENDKYAFILSDKAASDGRYAYASTYLDGTPTGLTQGLYSSELRMVPGDCYTYMDGDYPSPVAEVDFAPDAYTGANYSSPFQATYDQY